jgi:chromosome partitioning protein
MSYTIAIANQKGGVAKTTSAISLGGAFVQAGNQVLLIDLDPQADLTLAMGLDPRKAWDSIAEVLLSSGNLASIARETVIPGLDLVPSNTDLNLAEQFLGIRSNYELILRNAIATHLPLNAYDYVILDCPPALGALTLNALMSAQLLIIPTQPEYFSAYALKSMLTAVKRARSQGNPTLQYRILITMQDLRNRVHRNLSEELRSTFGKGVLQTVIEIDTKVRESSIAGLPVTHFCARTRSSLQYRALTQELFEHVQETVAQSVA